MEEQGFSEPQIGMFTIWLSIVVDGLFLVALFVQTICFPCIKACQDISVCVWTSVCLLLLLWCFFLSHPSHNDEQNDIYFCGRSLLSYWSTNKVCCLN